MDKDKFLSTLHSGIDRFIDNKNKSDNDEDWFSEEDEKILDALYDFFDKNLKNDPNREKEELPCYKCKESIEYSEGRERWMCLNCREWRKGDGSDDEGHDTKLEQDEHKKDCDCLRCMGEQENKPSDNDEIKKEIDKDYEKRKEKLEDFKKRAKINDKKYEENSRKLGDLL